MVPLERHTIFLALAGSHAHGTARHGSDVDLRGVCVAPLPVRLSLFGSLEQYEGPLPDELAALVTPRLAAHPTARRGLGTKVESAVFDVAKFVGLCASANPNALEILFADERDWVLETPAWRRLHRERQRFLTKKVQQTFLGYAMAQLKKIKTHRSWLLEPPTKKSAREDSLSLEPISAPKAARSALSSVARSLAEELAGVIDDPQEGTLSLPRGTKRYEKPKREERFTVLDLSWWYTGSPLRADDGPRTRLAMLAKHLPESIPRRYGSWEPPRYKTEETGLSGLESFIAQHLDDSPVFYTTRPVVGLSIADFDAAAHPRFGFRANLLSIEVEASALDQPGWERALRRMWRDVSSFLLPFYGEARLLSNFMRHGVTTYSDMKTDIHPVHSSFWRGLPPKLGLACVLGPPYSRLWQPPGAEPFGELRFLDDASWRDRRPLALPVPPDLAQRWMPAWAEHPGGGYAVNWCDQLPATWRFQSEVNDDGFGW